MFGWLTRKPRPLSSAEKELLCVFVDGADLQTVGADERWQEALGEAPAHAVQRLVAEDLLASADSGTKLKLAFSEPGLKFLLRQMHLSTDGDRDALVARLLRHDPQGMRAHTRELDIYQCTPAGRDVALAYRRERTAERQSVENETVARLERGDYAGALQLAGVYEARQMFPRGSGIRWAESGADADSRDRLRYIFSRTPRLIAYLDAETLEPLRIAAALQSIWGTEEASQWLPEGLEIPGPLDAEGLCRALLFHADYLVSLEKYRSRGFRHVTISHVNDGRSCPACTAIAGRQIPIDSAPELPYPGCTCRLGCRCTIHSA